MGITGFYSWIETNYPGAFTEHSKNINYLTKDNTLVKKPIFFNHIYIDLNYLLHMCTYNSPNIFVTIKKIETIILEICSKFHAIDSINICCDGSAPLAKLFLQRTRRLQEARILRSENVSANLSSIDLKNSSLNFTPGSVFMETLHEKFSQMKEKIESSLNVRVNINNLNPGEAEIKIKYLINKHLDENPMSSHLLVTNDADVLLIISSTKFYKSIYVLLKNNVILSLNKLINEHSQKFGSGIYPNYDFAFLNLLNGNDYLPKLRYVTTDKLWKAYKIKLRKHKGLILKKNIKSNFFEINNDFLIDILKSLGGMIGTNILKKTKLYEYKIKDYESYINGLVWCFHMYFNGECRYNNYIYEGNSPDPLLLMCHLIKYNINNSFSLNESKSISNKLCSILLLPDIARQLIDDKYYQFMEKHSYLYEEEKCEECQVFYEKMKKLNKEYSLTEHKDYSIRKKIASTQKTYENHKEKHIKLNSTMIEKIKKEYSELNFLLK
jgi:hypothetical protein